MTESNDTAKSPAGLEVNQPVLLGKDQEAQEARKAADDEENQSRFSQSKEFYQRQAARLKDLADRSFGVGGTADRPTNIAPPASPHRDRPIELNRQSKQFKELATQENAGDNVAESGAVRLVVSEEQVSVTNLEHSEEVQVPEYCKWRPAGLVKGIRIGDQEVWATFPTLIMILLESVKRTTLGAEIVRAAIPCQALLIRFGMLLQYVTVYFSNLYPLVFVLIIVLSGCESAAVEPVNEVSTAYQWVVRTAAVSAFINLVALVLIYLLCMWIPLTLVIIPLALVRQRSCAGFIKLHKFTHHQRIRGVEIDINSHALAASLSQQTSIVYMTYDTEFEKTCQELFFRELSIYKFFITQWLFMEAKRFSDIDEAMVFFDEGWGRFVGTLLIAAACYALQCYVSRLLWNTWHVVKRLLDLIFCFIPTRTQEWAVKKITTLVLKWTMMRVDAKGSEV